MCEMTEKRGLCDDIQEHIRVGDKFFYKEEGQKFIRVENVPESEEGSIEFATSDGESLEMPPLKFLDKLSDSILPLSKWADEKPGEVLRRYVESRLIGEIHREGRDKTVRLGCSDGEVIKVTLADIEYTLFGGDGPNFEQ